MKGFDQQRAVARQRISDFNNKYAAKLEDQTKVVSSFLEQSRIACDKSERNIRAMRKAVAVSQQPGSIAYNQTPPDLQQATWFAQQVGVIERQTKDLDIIYNQKQQFRKDDLKQMESYRPGGIVSLKQWLETYGTPKREPNKHERWLTYCCKPNTLVKGASSRDKSVVFKTTYSNAVPVRKGMLAD